MGVRVLYDSETDHAALYDSVSMTPFGELFGGANGLSGEDRANRFLDWLEACEAPDPRAPTANASLTLWRKRWAELGEPDA